MKSQRPGAPARLALALAAILAAVAMWPVDRPAAQGLQNLKSGDEPLEIVADQGIEWRRDEQIYVARGNALAVRGDISVYADVMSAHYSKQKEGGTDIDRIDVEGNVRIVSPSETVYGDRGVYDVVNGVLVLVGRDLRLIGERDTITARDSLEYWEKKNLAVARGDAEARREDKRIKADVLSAYFVPDKANNLTLNRIEAFGNVRVSTPTEFARGDHGIYFAERELATLTGGVKITREENQLNGEYAEVDMKTGVSRLLPGPPGETSGNRVRGLLVPNPKPRRKPAQGGAS